ncbi:MAG: hypothetical protein EHM67_09715 [Hyphomicrobiaceae bacterium]|nr:MAG: hypothetical protein EHM67_09715 [Hyphomicrobiaceae bacterium]
MYRVVSQGTEIGAAWIRTGQTSADLAQPMPLHAGAGDEVTCASSVL